MSKHDMTPADLDHQLAIEAAYQAGWKEALESRDGPGTADRSVSPQANSDDGMNQSIPHVHSPCRYCLAVPTMCVVGNEELVPCCEECSHPELRVSDVSADEVSVRRSWLLDVLNEALSILNPLGVNDMDAALARQHVDDLRDWASDATTPDTHERDVPERFLGKVIGSPPERHDFYADCVNDPDIIPPVYSLPPYDRVCLSAGGVEYQMLPSQARALAALLHEAASWGSASRDEVLSKPDRWVVEGEDYS